MLNTIDPASHGVARSTAVRAGTVGRRPPIGGVEPGCQWPPAGTGADLAKALGGDTTAGKWGAVPAGDIVITALLYDGVVPVVAQYGDALANKVIVDISNPFNATFDGLAHSEETSVAQEVAKVAPASASVVKAFNTIFRNVLETGRPDVFFAGDDAQAKAVVAEFINSIGLRPLDVGDLKMARWLEGAGLLTMGLANNGVGHWDFALGVNEFAA
jgi:8-hydroxy-5-deazaflavin:NADPH oxidoreductase